MAARKAASAFLGERLGALGQGEGSLGLVLGQNIDDSAHPRADLQHFLGVSPFQSPALRRVDRDGKAFPGANQ